MPPACPIAGLVRRSRSMQFDEASWIALERAAGGTLRGGLERALRSAILDGSLRAGTRLPSSRALATTLGVSRGVTSDAYGQLEAQGLLVVAPRAAPVVAHVERGAVARPRRVRAPGAALRLHPDDTRRDAVPAAAVAPPRLPTRHAARRPPTSTTATRRERASCGRARRALGLTRGVVDAPEQIVITQGTAQAIVVLLATLRRRGASTVGGRGSLPRQPGGARAPPG